MKLFSKLLLTTIFLFSVTNFLSAQSLACNTNVQITLDGSGNVTITPEFLIEGNTPTAGLVISIDGGPEAASHTLDCTYANMTFQYTVIAPLTGISCWGEFTIEDKLAPIAICNNDIGVELTDGKVEISAGQIDEGSYDNCPDLRLTFDAFAFDFESVVIDGNSIDRSVDHYFNVFGPVGLIPSTPNALTVAYENGELQKWVADENTSYKYFTELELATEFPIMSVTDVSGNHTYCVVNINASSSSGILSNTTVSTRPWDCNLLDIHAETLLTSGTQYDNVSASFDNISFSSVLSGSSYQGGDEFYVYVKYDKDGDDFFGVVLINGIDNIPPVTVVDQGVTVQLTVSAPGQSPSATIYPETLDDGSYDHCSDVTFSLSKSTFGIADIGLNNVVLTVFDESGNFNQGMVEVTVIGPQGCNDDIESLIQWPLPSLNINNPNVSANQATPDYLINVLGYGEALVYPQITSTCVIGIGYDDQVFNNGSTWKIIRNWTVINWNNSSTASFIQVIDNDPDIFSDVLACINLSTVIIGDSPFQLYAEDFLVGYNGNVADLLLVITDEDGDVILNNLISNTYAGQTLTYTVTHTPSGNVCWGTLNAILDGNQNPCNGGPGEVFDWPTETTIEISNPNADAADLNAMTLINSYGFTSEQVEPQILNLCADGQLGIGIDNTVIPLSSSTSGNYFKILRTFTVINWNTSSLWTFDQVIKNTVDPNDFICDFLPRTAPLGDCDSGHTDMDDVEWPADLQIADYRISPEELVDFSNIDELDVRPSFYNESALYTASYEDNLISLSSTMIVLGREWTVDRTDGTDLSWTYIQEVAIDITDFANLIVTTTTDGIAIPGVTINNFISTNSDGKAIFEGNGPFNLSKEGDFLDGVDIRDLTLMRRHILGINTLDPIHAIAGDIDEDGEFNTLDIVIAERAIVGLEVPEVGKWKFLEKENTGTLSPKEVFIGAKMGDMDDSNSLTSASSYEDYNLVIEDILLNNGEKYIIEIRLDNPAEMMSAQYIFDFDENLLQLDQVEVEFGSFFENLDQNVLNIVNNMNAMPVSSGDSPLLNLHVTAKNNGILSEALKLSENEPSMFIDENLDYQILKGTYNGIISSTFDDPSNALSFVNVYPNPASQYLNFDFEKVDVKDISISILDVTGKQQMRQSNTTSIDVSKLADGMYIYQITDGSSIFMNKFLKLDQ